MIYTKENIMGLKVEIISIWTVVPCNDGKNDFCLEIESGIGKTSGRTLAHFIERIKDGTWTIVDTQISYEIF